LGASTVNFGFVFRINEVIVSRTLVPHKSLRLTILSFLHQIILSADRRASSSTWT
jgi:hypothetical protein